MSCIITLYLGTRRPDSVPVHDERSRHVSDAAFRTFLIHNVVPAWPEGFTVAENQGFWRYNDTKTLSEKTFVLTRVVFSEELNREKAQAETIARAWKRLADQESVLMTVHGADHAFV